MHALSAHTCSILIFSTGIPQASAICSRKVDSKLSRSDESRIIGLFFNFSSFCKIESIIVTQKIHSTMSKVNLLLLSVLSYHSIEDNQKNAGFQQVSLQELLHRLPLRLRQRFLP